MAIAGRVAIVPKGDWSADATYKRLDAVTYNNTLYFAKKDVPVGTATSNTEYWSKSIVGGASAIATTEKAGIVKPDGTTITVDEDGTLHGSSQVDIATTAKAGIVKPDGKSMSVDESGTLSINLDGTTITLDEAKNVIKLADALKDKIGSALQPESIVNNQIATVEGFALDARQANPNIDGSLAKQISDLNGSLNVHKAIWKDIKVQGDAVNTYQEVFSYTPESDCLISLYANAYYSSGKPIGLKASVAGNIVDSGDTNEMIVSKVESDNYKEIIISCNVYVLAGHKIKIEEKISSYGYFAGGIVYTINRL